MKITNSSSIQKTINVPNGEIIIPANGEIELETDITTIMIIQHAIAGDKELTITDIDTTIWRVT